MKRNKFSLSHYNLLTMNMGPLVPLGWQEVLPGDSLQHATSLLIRVSPLLAPVMHPVMVRIHHWFVPYRLLWEDFEDFITGGPDGTSVPVHPTINITSVTEGTLQDYMGLPVTLSCDEDVSALPFRAYNMIWNENYRDQDLQTEQTFSIASGADSTTDLDLVNTAWEKDYFTTCRPWPQKGDDVVIPLGDAAPVQSSGTGIPLFDGTGSGTNLSLAGDGSTLDARLSGVATGSLQWNDPKLEADLSSATGIPIADLRLALAIQRYQEARAKYGSRYTEYLRYLGVRSSDSRLQSPEYLGGGRQVIQFSEVLSTDGANTGDMKGHGIAAMRTNRYRRFFEEHGLVMTLCSVIPKTMYTAGLHRKWSRSVKEDYFQRELQFIGEQEVMNKEVAIDHTTPDGIFGYQARYDEYRSHPSSISGEFYSTNDHWHMARTFASDPALNSTFIAANPTNRIYASSDTDQLYIMANHSIQARRLLARTAKNKTF